jgi:hypothetical protein
MLFRSPVAEKILIRARLFMARMKLAVLLNNVIIII